MVPYPGGMSLEVGSMVNPATGCVTAYEELWIDKAPVPHSSSTQKPKCVVFQLLDEPASKRGQFVRFGHYAQGVLRVGDTFTAERWLWSETHTRWEQTVKAGDNHGPLGFLLDARQEPVKVGDKVEGPMGTWTAIECRT